MNPFDCKGTALPANLLLMAKLVALGFVLNSDLGQIPDVYLPFVSWLDPLRSSAHLFQWCLRVTFAGATLSLLLNRAPRLCCALLGAAVWLWTLASRPAYQTNILFCGCLFILLGLYEERWGPRLLRYQVGVLYLGAGLNKLLDADWQSGRMVDNLVRLIASGQSMPFVVGGPAQIFLRASALVPVLPAACAWGTIATELSLAAGCFLSRRRFVLWAGVALHAGLTVFTGMTFNMYLTVMLAARLAFFDFDRELTIRGPPAPAWVQRLWRLTGLRPPARWIPAESLAVIVGDRAHRGLSALKLLALSSSATYFALLVALSVVTGELLHPLSSFQIHPAFIESLRWGVLLTVLFWTPIPDAIAHLFRRRAHATMGVMSDAA